MKKNNQNFISCEPSLGLRFQALGNETFIKQLEVGSSITKNKKKESKFQLM
jgi:hypothetical protein